MAAWPPLVKLLAGLGASWFGIQRGELHHLKDKFDGLLRGWKGEAQYKQSTCQACLDAGEDFCISSNKCIKRATFNCKGPYDHITGDKEFALHGNPEGIQHSMTCPADKKDGVDKNDCYFDKECHDKVDWAQITKVKKGFFGRLKYFKEKDNAEAALQMMKRVYPVFKKAGMPEDRIMYILEKWVKSVFPEALEKKGGVDKKDCYFDKECHAKVDWNKIGQIKKGFFARLKYFKEKDDKSSVQEMLKKVHAKFKDAGMPEDRIDYILDKWVKFVYPEALHGDTPKPKPKPKWGMCTLAKMRCMKDGEKVLKGKCMWLWKKCGYELEKDAFDGSEPKRMCTLAKMKCMKNGEKVLEGRCMWLWKKCGHELGMDSFDFKPEPKPSMCEWAKKRCMKDGEKNMEGRCGFAWKDCGKELGILV